MNESSTSLAALSAPTELNCRYVRIDQIKLHKVDGKLANPPQRTIEDARHMKRLVDSIRRIGTIVSPIVVDKHLFIIDGHRRLAAAKRAGLAEVPARIWPEERDDQLFYELNETALKLDNKQWVDQHSKGLPVPAYIGRSLETAQSRCGFDVDQFLLENDVSSSCISTVHRLTKICGRPADDDFFQATLKWMVHLKQYSNVRAALRENAGPSVFAKAIDKGVPIQSKWSA